MSKAELIARIAALPEKEFKRLEPYLAADLAILHPGAELLEEIRLGLKSADTEPLESHESVMARLRSTERRPATKRAKRKVTPR